VIENQRRRQSRRVEYRDTRCSVLRSRLALGFGNVHHGSGMTARITARVGIAAEQNFKRHWQGRFFFGFTHRGMFHGLADIHKTAG